MHGKWLRSRTTNSILLPLLLTAPLAAQDPASHRLLPGNLPLQPAPSFFVRLDVNHATGSYREGDTLSVRIASEIDCHAYVLYQQADGRMYQVFPNRSQPDNRLRARQAVEIPGHDDAFRWVVAAPFGAERIILLCTRSPFEPLATSPADNAGPGPFPKLSRERWKGVEVEIGRETPTEWGIAHVELTSYPRSAEARPTDQRRVGVFFGVAQYQFQVEAEAAGDRGLNLPTCHRDARRMAELLQEVGELSEFRAFTNEQATRAQMEQAITGWLPQVTRPGDTIFLYFSGHGAKLPDDNGDELDGEDEVLIPHDFVSLNILQELIRRAGDGTLDPAQGPRATEALEIAQRAGSSVRAAEALVRETGVTDDQFAHWLQRLDQRRIVVILDICFAGGFAVGEKSAAALDPSRFDFVDRELSRLKDLGQRDLALLASSSTREVSSIRGEKDLSVMTYYLAEAIQHAPARLSLEQAFQECAAGMAAYFTHYNQQAEASGRRKLTPHQPQLFPFSTRAQDIYLKP